jgi:hypothetical protein
MVKKTRTVKKMKTKRSKKLKIFIITTLIIIVSGLMVSNWLNQLGIDESVGVESSLPCSFVPSKFKSQCETYRTECQALANTKESATFCLANKVSEFGLDVSENICKLLENSAVQKHCFAKVLSGIDLEKAKKQCDLINDIVERADCKADILKENDMKAALVECEAALEPDQINWCKARMIAFNNKTESIKYCNLIIHQALKQVCYTEIEKAAH